MKERVQFLTVVLVLSSGQSFAGGPSIEDRVDFAECKGLLLKSARYTEAVRCFQELPAPAKSGLSYTYYLALAYDGSGDLARALDGYTAYAKSLEKTRQPAPPELIDKIASVKTRIKDAQKATEKADAFNLNQPPETQRQKVEAYGRKYPEDPDAPARLRQLAAQMERDKLRKDLSGLWQRGASRFRITQTGSRIVAVFESVGALDARLGFGPGERKLEATMSDDGRVVGTFYAAAEPQGASDCYDPQSTLITKCSGNCAGSNRRQTQVQLVVSENGREMSGWFDAWQLDYKDCSWLASGTNPDTWSRLNP